MALNFGNFFWFAAGLVPIFIVGRWLDQIHSHRRNHPLDAEAIAEAKANFAKDLDDERSTQAQFLRSQNVNPAQLKTVAHEQSGPFWKRSSDDPELGLFVPGLGEVDWRPEVDRDAAVAARLDDTLRSRSKLLSVPISYDLTVKPLAFVGPREAALACARHAVISLTVMAPPSALVLGLESHLHVNQWDWLKWLPHLEAKNVSDGNPLLVRIIDGDVPDRLDADTAIIVADKPDEVPPWAQIAKIDNNGVLLPLTEPSRPSMNKLLAVGLSNSSATEIATILAGYNDIDAATRFDYYPNDPGRTPTLFSLAKTSEVVSFIS